MNSKRSFLVISAILLTYFILQFNGLYNLSPGDEHVYFYMAKLVNEGQLPYRDFFYAHPPLHLLFLFAIVKIFGINFIILKSSALISIIGSAFFLYLALMEFFETKLGEEKSAWISGLAVMLYLFSFEILFKATFSIGINFSLMLLLASFYSLQKKLYSTAGIIAGLAGLSGFYTLPAILAILLFLFFKKLQEKNLKDFFKYSVSFFAVFGLSIIFLALVFGQGFIDPVIKYHILKPEIQNDSYQAIENAVKENWMLFAGILLSIFARSKSRLQIFYFIIIAHFIFLALINVVEEFYFAPAFPFMAAIGSYSIINLIQKIKNAYIKYFIVAMLSFFFLWNTTADAVFLNKVGFRSFEHLDDIVHIASTTSPESKIFGDDSIITLVGLMANKDIALNFVDSNEKRFTSGLTNFYEFTNHLDDEDISLIILRKDRGLYQILEFRDYVMQRCMLIKEYHDIAEGSFLIYHC